MACLHRELSSCGLNFADVVKRRVCKREAQLTSLCAGKPVTAKEFDARPRHAQGHVCRAFNRAYSWLGLDLALQVFQDAVCPFPAQHAWKVALNRAPSGHHTRLSPGKWRFMRHLGSPAGLSEVADAPTSEHVVGVGSGDPLHCAAAQARPAIPVHEMCTGHPCRQADQWQKDASTTSRPAVLVRGAERRLLCFHIGHACATRTNVKLFEARW